MFRELFLTTLLAFAIPGVPTNFAIAGTPASIGYPWAPFQQSGGVQFGPQGKKFIGTKNDSCPVTPGTGGNKVGFVNDWYGNASESATWNCDGSFTFNTPVHFTGGSDVILPGYTVAAGPLQFPATCTDNTLARALDNIRGVWICTSNRWSSVTGVANLLDWSPNRNGATDDAAIINSWLSVAADGVRLYMPAGNYAIASTIAPPEGISGFRIITDHSHGYAGVTLTWTGALGGTMFRFPGDRFFYVGPMYLYGGYVAGTAGAGIGILLDTGDSGDHNYDSWTFDHLNIIGVKQAPGVAFQWGNGDSSPAPSNVYLDHPQFYDNTVGIKVDGGGMQDMNLLDPAIAGSERAIWLHAGSGPINVWGGSLSAFAGAFVTYPKVHFYLESGTIAAHDTTLEGVLAVDWISHDQTSRPLYLDNVQHLNNVAGHDPTVTDSGGDAIRLGGGEYNVVINGGTYSGNINASSYNGAVGGITVTNAKLLYGSFLPPPQNTFIWSNGSNGLYVGVVPPLKLNYSPGGVVAKDQFVAVGSTLGSELITDGDMEAAGTANWTPAGVPTTVAKNAVAPISGTQDLHIVTDGTINYQGVTQSIGTAKIGSIYEITWKHRIVTGGFRMVMVGAAWRYSAYYEQNIVDFGDQTESHTAIWVCTTQEAVSIALYGKDSTASEFYVDDVSVKEVTAGSLVAATSGYFKTAYVDTLSVKTIDSPLPGVIQPTYGANVAINAALGRTFEVDVTDANAFQIDNPTNGVEGMDILIYVVNTTAGAVANPTWGNQYLQVAGFVSPAVQYGATCVTFRKQGSYWRQSSTCGGEIAPPP